MTDSLEDGAHQEDDRVFSDLLRRARSGDAAAKDELCQRHAPALLARVRSRLSPALRRRYDSIDVMQSVTAELLQRLEEFEDRGERAFRSWLYRTAENRIRSKWRKAQGPDGSRETSVLRESERTTPPSSDRGPATDAEFGEASNSANDRLARLGPEARQLVLLRVQEDLSFEEIADRIGAPSANAVRMRFSRAIRALRRMRDS